jgi:D-alanyl-D-alanine carboxypeptidase/D-alanyl-D-alanine-endopeptidase (penicillin-binding protein 4)
VIERRRRLAAVLLAGLACLPACRAARQAPQVLGAPSAATSAADLRGDLDRILDAPPLARALIGVHVVSLRDGRVIYARDAHRRVVPASNMKLVTAAVAAERLGWDFRFRTRLEAIGSVRDGTLHGDLVVTGDGDPTITAQRGELAPLFLEWAETAAQAGIRRVAGRLIGDDNALDDMGLGAGWAWDYLEAGYAAPSGALTYNENVVQVEIRAGAAPGRPAAVRLSPSGHGLELVNEAVTVPATSPAGVSLSREPGSVRLVVRGAIPASSGPVVRTASVPNPTRFLMEALRLALAARGIAVTGGAWDIDDISEPVSGPRTVVAQRISAPLSSLAGHFLKVSQNMYGETLLKTLGRTPSRPGSAAEGRQVVAQTLASWGVAPDAIIMYDGSGLSRYNYVTAEAITAILARMWRDERLRGPFVAALPVGAHDGTLESRMKNSLLDRRVQAKTGTISNVRSLSGFVETLSGEKLAFSVIANHFTAPSAEIDSIVEAALERIVRGEQPR